MMKANEIIVSRIKDSHDIAMQMTFTDATALSIHVPRELAINLLQQIYIGLDINNILEREPLDS